MSNAWVLMTAMPPTKGHINLIRFAANLPNVDEVNVIVCTQPGEPFAYERFAAVCEATDSGNFSDIYVYNLHATLPQDPSSEGFWEIWDSIMRNEFDSFYMHNDGAQPGDYYVTSEPYGKTLADRLGGIFMPYDPDRELYYTKATKIRDNLEDYFHDIAPEFQDYVRTNIVVFGAESTGKTTLSKRLSYELNGHWFFEWARPYLETVGPEINVDSMTAIWHGQFAIQMHSYDFYDKPYAIFDTDLYSTIGYWEQPHWEADLGPVPKGLKFDAMITKADLYIITRSNIPFEEDPIRYGGDRRESDDDYWIGVAEKYNLPYVVLESSDFEERVRESVFHAKTVMQTKADALKYDRGGF